ncbi:uncharacterized protein LOC133744874 [Rosa rugosa]|uniref:uncharacterized protein LOC133744874 n=1 Tax=Rosa rugosa TaxID=74645 RepID=UPI002B4037A3|nr:uncharacterized protein LOC133744874 [Rosa rugosa]
MYCLTRKITKTRRALEKWQQETFRLRQQQMMEVRGKLEVLMDEPMSEAIHIEKKELMVKLQTLLSQEEAFWKQRAKVTWLKEGDCNSGFFHRKAANRKRKNNLLGLFDTSGQWHDDDDDMEEVVSSYFAKMFTASSVDTEAVEITLAAIQPSVTSDMNLLLCAQYTEDEVRCALFQMYPTKSPGPDGMPPLFFQHYWDTIGKDVTTAVQSFLHTANEVAHYVHSKREGQDGYMALKLDLSKAYDRMEWSFLRKVLVRFGFAQSWIDVVMQCVSSVRYSFLVREKPRDLVIPTRGLRQASLEACFQIKEVLAVYGRASGQVVNFNKSSVAFSKNVSAYEQAVVANLLGMEIVESHERYLGLPTYVGRKKTATFQYIKERLAEKLKNWQGKLLSGAGKDIMIRVVAQALPNYAMSVFQLTKSFCVDLEQMCARFWWGSTDDKRKIHWKSWDFLCHPNEIGGLGFRSLTEFNMSMLAKQAWRVIDNPDSLVAQLYKAHYFPNGSFWTAEEHASPSYSWRSIFASRELLKEGSRWQIGDGNKWDEHRVRSIVSPSDATTILSIPLSVRSPEDRRIWHLEKKACKAALAYIATNSICPAIIETDCLLLQQQLCQRGMSNTSELGRIYEDLKHEMALLHQLRVVHVKRDDAKKAAHAIAAYAAINSQEFSWSNVPSFIQDVIASELCTI